MGSDSLVPSQTGSGSLELAFHRPQYRQQTVLPRTTPGWNCLPEADVTALFQGSLELKIQSQLYNTSSNTPSLCSFAVCLL